MTQTCKSFHRKWKFWLFCLSLQLVSATLLQIFSHCLSDFDINERGSGNEFKKNDSISKE